MPNVPVWTVQDAKARFSELITTAVEQGPQMVTRRGVELAVVVPLAEWRRLQGAARPSLKELLLADHPRLDLDLPSWGALRRRPPVDFECGAEAAGCCLETNVVPGG